jgi:hypothetical protein
MGDYWHPQFKWQLVEWFHSRYPSVPIWKWERMSKRQLWGKYKEVRDEMQEVRSVERLLDAVLV